MNLVTLAPGQTIRLDAGNLHAYLHGAGVELMGASIANVVRSGLTVKEADVDELLRCSTRHRSPIRCCQRMDGSTCHAADTCSCLRRGGDLTAVPSSSAST